LPNQVRVSHLDPTKSINSLDEKKENRGDYLKELVGNELHEQIQRSPPRFERDLSGGERWGAWLEEEEEEMSNN
jgi:hypothetical protein